MAHYAFIDEENIVVNVITGRDESDVVDGIADWEIYYENLVGMRCLRTSYNTIGGVHATGGVPFRGNYAGVGFTYDEDLDAFIAPQPFPSWTLNETTYSWEAPVPRPEDGDYDWNEDSQEWEAFVAPVFEEGPEEEQPSEA